MSKSQNETSRIQIGRVYLIKRPVSPIWYVEWCHDGKQQRKSTKTRSKKEATKIADVYSAKLTLGQLPSAAKRRKEQLNKAIVQRLEFLKNQKPNGHTIANYERAYTQLLYWSRQHFGREPRLKDLTTDVLHEFEKELRTKGVQVQDDRRKRRQGAGNAPGTLHNKMKDVRSLIKWAVDYGLVGEDPSPQYKVPPRYLPDVEAYSPEQVSMILSDPDPNMRDIWLIFLRTGMRSSELRYLLKEDVDLDVGIIRIRKKRLPTGKQWTPKHGHERTIPVNDAELMAALRRQTERSQSAWAFWTGDNWKNNGGQWRSARLINRLQGHLKNMGIKRGTLHMLRHTCLTFLANAGMPIAQVRDFAGHNDIRVTMRYVHVKTPDVARSLTNINFSQMAGQNEENKD